MKKIGMKACMIYGEFLIFISPAVRHMPSFVQDSYVHDADMVSRYIACHSGR